MAYKKTDQIFVRTLHMGYIPHLKTSGPIVNPIKVDVATCHSMILSGIDLYELDPATKMTIKLTASNLYDDKKFEKLQGEAKVEDKAKVVKEVELPGVSAKTDKVEKEETSSVEEDVKKSDEEIPVAESNEAEEVKKEEQKPVKENNHNKNKNGKK